MLLGRLRIRGKLIVLVLIPLLAVVGLAVPIVVDRVNHAQRAGDIADNVQVASRMTSLVQELQKERFLSVGFLLDAVDRAQLTELNTKINQHLTDLKAAGVPKDVAAALDLPELPDLRGSVHSHSTTPDKVITGYTTLITRVIDSLDLEDRADVATSGGRQITALDAALRIDDGITVGVAYLLLIVATKNPALLVQHYSNLATIQVWGTRFSEYATPEQVKLYNQVSAETTARFGDSFADPVNADPMKALAQIPLTTAVPAMQSIIGQGQVVENKIISDVTKTVNRDRRNALTTAYGVGGGAVLVLLLAVLLSVAVARAVTRPLTRLTASADRVARVAEAELVRVADDETDSPTTIHLDAVAVGAKDEIGDLARAFERVQGTAAGLVERQVTSRRNFAQMFGHVGRRTQNLVARQVALIDRLERDEANPDRLQHLYRLDHVSSRLRRNAGSLVVLSGATSMDSQVSPLPLADAVRLALGEIEDYTRVDVHVPADITLVPSVINDMVLMLAELMENATVFSPPHVRVTVSAQQMSYGVQLAVVDHGIGLTEERLEQENARLERRERLDLAPTEVLGLFVVGRLSRRHELGVTLSATPGGGVTATLQIGQHLLVQTAGDPTVPLGGMAALASPTPPGMPMLPSSSLAMPVLPGTPPPGMPMLPSPLVRRPAPPAAPAVPAMPAAHRAPEMPAIPAAPEAPEVPAAPAAPAVPAAPAAPAVPAAPAAPAVPAAPAAPAVPAVPMIGRASVPPAEPAPVHQAAPAPEPVVLRLAPSIFDQAAVDRASRSMAAATPWSAFVAHPRTDTANGLSWPPARPEPEQPQQPEPAPAARAPVLGAQALLKQRVPGTHMAAMPAPAGPNATAPKITDAAAVKALVEDFELGVRRAEREEQLRQTGPAAPPPLTRRVPGVTLGALHKNFSARPAVSEALPDPEEARSLVEQFEAGVTRALREVRTDPQHEEGTPR